MLVRVMGDNKLPAIVVLARYFNELSFICKSNRDFVTRLEFISHTVKVQEEIGIIKI